MSVIEKNIIAQAKRFGEPLPERIQNKPKLALGLAFYLDAFVELDTDRAAGFGLGAIPWSSLHTYALAHEMAGDDYHDFMYILRKLDNAYLKHVQSKGSKDAEST